MTSLRPWVLSGLAVAALLGGCSSVAKVVNEGGDTTCKVFTSSDEQKQNDAVTKMLKDKRGSEPANLEVTGTRLSVITYCKTLGNDNSKISEAPHA